MFCSTSISIHLLRGLAALGLIIGAMYSSSYGSIGLVFAALAFVGAIVLLRGCPMCWLVGLFETLRQRREETS
ncbi:hypothetical protein [Undibacterium sp.]|uniref:hypothetical protein n=1 Tax=Undibacterium sp. TaxID=1914977 RepID=UPI0037505E60